MNIALARLGLLLFVVEFFPGILLAQVKTQIEDNSYLNIDRNQIAWPSPESVLADLRSSNDDLRLKALRLVGLTDQQSQRAVWVSVNGGPAKIIGQAIAAPERAQLIYAAMGEDTSEAAIVAFVLRPFEATYAAVAIREGQRWQRIATIDCWCKYEMRSDQDVLDEFVSLRPAAEPAREITQHYELVVRTSGGGTGIYTQVEDHYRIFHNELRNVLQFVSRHYGSDPTGPAPSTTQERRWFTTGPMANGEWGGTLVEATTEFGANALPVIPWEVRSLLDLHLKNVACTAYRWDEKAFRYLRTNESVPACQPPAKSP